MARFLLTCLLAAAALAAPATACAADTLVAPDIAAEQVDSNGSFTAPRVVVTDFGAVAGGWLVDSHPRVAADTTGDGRAGIVGFSDVGVVVSRALADATSA